MPAVTKLGCFTQDALNGLLQTDPASTQTLTGDLTVTGSIAVGGSTVDAGVITGDVQITGSLDVDTDINCDGNVVIDGTTTLTGATTQTGALGLAAAGFTMASIARTATATGATTGTIASGPMLQHVTVTSDSADKIIILPSPTPGNIVILSVAATGYELRSSAPATVAINGGAEADAESAIPANTTAVLICESATSWKGLQMGSDGTLAKVQVAAAA